MRVLKDDLTNYVSEDCYDEFVTDDKEKIHKLYPDFITVEIVDDEDALTLYVHPQSIQFININRNVPLPIISFDFDSSEKPDFTQLCGDILTYMPDNYRSYSVTIPDGDGTSLYEGETIFQEAFLEQEIRKANIPRNALLTWTEGSLSVQDHPAFNPQNYDISALKI